MPKGNPIQEQERLEWIDTVRGLAIFGIFMVNVPAFNAPFFLYGGGEEYFPSETSEAVRAVIDIFFQASFYTLFALMFGFGLQMMKDRLTSRGVAYEQVLARRLFVLFLFGVIHAFVIWHGDILLTYSVLGALLLLFMKRKDRTLLLFAYGLLAAVTVPFTLMLYAARNYGLGSVNREGIEAAMANYGNGSLLDIWSQNNADWWYTNSLGNWPFLIMSMLPMMLFGMYIARKRWLHEPENHEVVIWKWWSVTGVLFFLFKLGPYFFGTPEWFDMAQDNIGGSASAVFYVLSITLLYKTTAKKVVRPLRWVGRMSLTNYILQSIVSFFAFYSVGFGLYGEVTPLQSTAFVVIIFTLQIIISRWWLQKYRYGPLEWVWRSATYKRKV
ncbi:DUF418 domain-containing protein [Salimicrobium flavidum]|uniref:DUF418 domain-containing protein n=1 Tax=Salimicrobium flavidum TaxID=570947 RepID=A0A1N7JEH3_9BACI|nr:DUF418 domain-containing protein [Salimicrobium flavidum]SIS47636.1 uncharacterized protein SAMN05421687_105123 [Salimicrobium flavidum]